MGSEEVKKVEPEVEGDVAAAAAVVDSKEKGEEEEQQQDMGKDKGCPKPDEKLAIVASPQKVVEDPVQQSIPSPVDRDAVRARVEKEKRYALIKAWEESEKTKADNRAHKKISSVGAWENAKRAAVEAQLKKIEEKLEKKKAEYGEIMKNKIAEIHKEAEENRAIVEAKRGEEFVKIEETASKFRAAGYIPRKYFGCFSG